MTNMSQAEAELLLNAADKRALASTTLLRRSRAASVFVVVTIVACMFLSFGLQALGGDDVSRFLTGGVAGAALALAALAYGEFRKLHLKVEALVALREQRL
jgi:small-conductance mechanosensitive channel